MISKQELQKIRIETATKMCIQYPHLITLLFQKEVYIPMSKNEEIRFRILKELTNLEPSIKHILSFYIKRNR